MSTLRISKSRAVSEVARPRIRLRLFKMDRLDKLTIAILVVLASYAAVLMFMEKRSSQQAAIENKRSQPAVQYLNPDLNNKIQQAKKFLNDNNLGKADMLANDLINEYPYEGQPHMIKGDLFMRRQQPIKAMYEYKTAVELNPDFLDKNTKLFQGKKIQVSIEEAQTAIETGLQVKPDDTQLKEDLKVLYYMRRKLAGSCS